MKERDVVLMAIDIKDYSPIYLAKWVDTIICITGLC
jgi:hypothetical protein